MMLMKKKCLAFGFGLVKKKELHVSPFLLIFSFLFEKVIKIDVKLKIQEKKTEIFYKTHNELSITVKM